MDASIINAIEATKSEDRNQYRFVKRTESNRLMRGARETECYGMLPAKPVDYLVGDKESNDCVGPGHTCYAYMTYLVAGNYPLELHTEHFDEVSRL